MLRELLNNQYKKFNNIIFIDDLDNNLYDVKTELYNYNIELYKFIQ